MAQQHICRCGKKTDKLVSYFDKQTQFRVTVCEDCANTYNLVNNKQFISVPFELLTEEQKRTPEPNAN